MFVLDSFQREMNISSNLILELFYLTEESLWDLKLMFIHWWTKNPDEEISTCNFLTEHYLETIPSTRLANG